MDGSVRAARNHMMVAEAFGDDPATVAALDAGSLYRLARAHAPIRQAITDRAKAGDRPTVNTIARATRRQPDRSVENWEMLWGCKQQATDDLVAFLTDDLKRMERSRCLALLRFADIEDVLAKFGMRRDTF